MVYILIFHIFESVTSLFFLKSMNKVLYYYYYYDDDDDDDDDVHDSHH